LGEVVVILIVGLLVFGPDRLPGIARQAAIWLRTARASMARTREELSRTLDVDPQLLADPRRAFDSVFEDEAVLSVDDGPGSGATGVAGHVGAAGAADGRSGPSIAGGRRTVAPPGAATATSAAPASGRSAAQERAAVAADPDLL
jgi:sec-independent protein translocase protein TatB